MYIKKSKLVAIIGIVGSLCAILLVLSLNFRPYLKVSQIYHDPILYNDQEVQIIGVVKDFSGGNFYLSENEDKILVNVANVVVPKDLKNDIQVVVTGTFSSSLVLYATQILVQCS